MMKVKILILHLLLFTSMLKADGVIVIPRPPYPEPHPDYRSTPYPLEVRYHKVEVEIKDGIALTDIKQEFYNPTSSRLEGLYIFPVPEGAVINSFSMDINGKEAKAELLDAEKAKKIYEDIVRSMKDPALLEYAGRNAFKVRIFPIEPHSTKKINIKYGELLKTDSGMTSYMYPLNTEKFSSKPIENVSIKIVIETKKKLKMVFSPTHKVEIKRNGENRATIGFEDSRVLPDKDFSLYFSTHDSNIGLDMMTYKTSDEDGFFIINISPSSELNEKEILQKNIIFVIDTSGSMAGKKMEQAKRALEFCVENLNDKDRFELIRFSTEAENLFGSLQTADSDNISKAKQFIETMKPIGGTNVEEALSKAFYIAGKNSGKNPSMIVFLTDGKPTIGRTDDNELIEIVQKNNMVKSRIFVFGIDYAINTHLLDRIAQESAGYRTYVTPEEDTELKLASFYEKIRFPVFSDLKIDFGGVKVRAVYPKKLPDLFRNSQIIVAGRYLEEKEARVTLEGNIAGGKKKFVYNVNFRGSGNGEKDFIPQIWAAQHVGYLLDKIRLDGENKELRDEIIEVARKYGIVTPYTSFLIIEDEEERKARGERSPSLLPLRSDLKSDRVFQENIKKEYRRIHEKEGAGSVNASREIFSLQNTGNREEIYQGRQRLEYRDSSGNIQNLASQVRNIQGRAVYQNNNAWIDSGIRVPAGKTLQKIRFASDEYFKLLEEKPASNQFLSLGKNVRFVMDGTLYEIHE